MTIFIVINRFLFSTKYWRYPSPLRVYLGVLRGFKSDRYQRAPKYSPWLQTHDGVSGNRAIISSHSEHWWDTNKCEPSALPSWPCRSQCNVPPVGPTELPLISSNWSTFQLPWRAILWNCSHMPGKKYFLYLFYSLLSLKSVLIITLIFLKWIKKNIFKTKNFW